jgi:hypothetical protein
MIQLTLSGMVEDGDEILIDENSIASIEPNHTSVNECTNVVMQDGSVYTVQETIDEIQTLMANAKSST